MRQRRGDRFRAVTPTIVVEDRADLLALYLPRGTRFLGPADSAGRITRDVMAEAGLAPTTWRDHAGLHLIRPGAASSVMARWRTSFDDFAGWYVNLQEPMRQTTMGFDTMDQTLDLVVDADGAVDWKDVEELEGAIAGGFFDAVEADAIWTEARRVRSSAEAGHYPFVTEIATWRPDPAWGVPDLRRDWADAVECERERP